MTKSTPAAFVLAIFLGFTSSQIHFPVSENNVCNQGEICVNFKKCGTAIRSWKQFRIQPKSCYFKGREHFVCCPSNTPTKPLTKANEQRVSEESKKYVVYR